MTKGVPRRKPGDESSAVPAFGSPDDPKRLQDSLTNAATRGWLYSVLSLAFYRPDGRASEVWRGVVDLIAVSGAVPPGVGSAQPPVTENYVERLEVEFNRLFVGPGHLRCPPYESVYDRERPRGEAGLLAGPSVFDVKKLYAQAGFQLSSSFEDYPDHISVELEFMAHLCGKESRSGEGDARRWASWEAEFLDRHIGRWAIQFADSVLRSTSHPFYVAGATLLKRFMLDELSSFHGQEGY